MPLWPFGKSETLLTATFEGREIAAMHKARSEVTPAVEITSASPALVLRDSQAFEHTYDLTSVIGDGARFLFFSLRIGPTFAVQPDCLLSHENRKPKGGIGNVETRGIRLQPFYLPQCSGKPDELIGRGLFVRGFHYSGEVTPGNVSHIAICDACHKSFRFQSFHAGFGNVVYYYCESGVHTLVVSSYAEGAPELLAEHLTSELEAFEAKLPPCDRCGTRFRYYNSFRCPHCRAPYIDFDLYPGERAVEYYGNYLYGGPVQNVDLLPE